MNHYEQKQDHPEGNRMTREQITALEIAGKHRWIKANDAHTEVVCRELVDMNCLWPQVGGRYKITPVGLQKLEQELSEIFA